MYGVWVQQEIGTAYRVQAWAQRVKFLNKKVQIGYVVIFISDIDQIGHRSDRKWTILLHFFGISSINGKHLNNNNNIRQNIF